MTDTIFVAPAPVGEGELPRVVRHPSRGFAMLPAEGDDWPNDFYTAARLRDGDVVEVARPTTEPEPAPEPHVEPAPAPEVAGHPEPRPPEAERLVPRARRSS